MWTGMVEHFHDSVHVVVDPTCILLEYYYATFFDVFIHTLLFLTSYLLDDIPY